MVLSITSKIALSGTGHGSTNSTSTNSSSSNNKNSNSCFSLTSFVSHAAVALIAYQVGVLTQSYQLASRLRPDQHEFFNAQGISNFKQYDIKQQQQQQQQQRKASDTLTIISNNEEDGETGCNCLCDEDRKLELGDIPPDEETDPENDTSNTNSKLGTVNVSMTTTTSTIKWGKSDIGESHVKSIRALFRGAAVVSREQFIKEYDLGVPWDNPVKGAEDVILFYSSSKAFPKSYMDELKKSATTSTSTSTGAGGWPKVQYQSATDATSNCDLMKVVLVKPAQAKINECIAIVPQWESYHLHKFMRWKDDKDVKNKKVISVSTKYKLKHVSRHHEMNGSTPRIPSDAQIKRYLPMLNEYLTRFDSTIQRLKPILDELMTQAHDIMVTNQQEQQQEQEQLDGGSRKAMKLYKNSNTNNNNAVVVMVCNFGQSELFFNFICSAKARKLDLSRILLFATDNEMYEVAKTIPDIKVFNVDNAFGDNIPIDAARVYGDRAFTGMMFSKLYCVHLVNSLGYDVLFQDVDVVWYKNPIDYFVDTKQSGTFDFYFQDDGARSNRYVPYSPNSGFYYVRNNARTKHFFSVFMRIADQIIVTASHQAVLNDLLADHASSTGLRVKVFARDSPVGLQFPGGYHYHYRRSYMRDMILGKQQPFLFHMSWTKNKDNKKNFYEQMGDWYLRDTCFSKTAANIPGLSSSHGFVSTCCSAEPIMVCHYSDKPSKSSCKSSPKIDSYGKPFWV